ncbi:MAG: T9SS type A sorting domain-containing protein [Bacteroidota bacterium]|nr:T9SS type A sorting domain-containing protein [Bacteroidota bacterium]
MKTTLLAFAACFASLPAISQITIGQNDMPNSGDSIHMSFAAGVGSIDHTLTGPNYFWDFSALTPIAQQLYRFEAPSSIPFNFLSSVSFLNPTPDSLPVIGNVPSSFIDYFKNGSSGYRQNGLSFQYTPLTTFTIPVVFTSNDYVYRFPLNYGDMDTSDAAYAINFPPLPYIGQTIHRENNVDGWGVIATPYGTFMSLRVVSVIQRIDTVSLDSVTGFSIQRPLEIEYKWLVNGIRVPVLEIDAQILFNAEVITNVIYRDVYNNSVPQVGVEDHQQLISSSSVYPNPAAGNCYVTYTMEGMAEVEIILTDISGREVKRFGKEMALPGNNSRLLDLSGIAPGSYLINITSEDSRLTRQVILTH